MFKKMLVAAAILASSNAVFAQGIPYVGASIGVNKIAVDSFTMHERKPALNIFGGYGSVVTSNIYLGGEAFFNKAAGTVSLLDGSISNRYSYGIDFIPGLMLTEHTMLFAKGGVTRASYKDYGSQNDITGLQAGLGLQTSLTEKLDLRGEYVYSNFNGFNNPTKLTTDQVDVGLVYKFE
jgi:opacity protein-like surface antigen